MYKCDFHRLIIITLYTYNILIFKIKFQNWRQEVFSIMDCIVELNSSVSRCILWRISENMKNFTISALVCLPVMFFWIWRRCQCRMPGLSVHIVHGLYIYKLQNTQKGNTEFWSLEVRKTGSTNRKWFSISRPSHLVNFLFPADGSHTILTRYGYKYYMHFPPLTCERSTCSSRGHVSEQHDPFYRTLNEWK